MKDKPFFAVVYMFVVTAFFSAILIGFARMTRDRVEANEQLNFERAVVQVFPEIEYNSNSQIHQVFTEQFQKNKQTGAYHYEKDGQIQGYAVPVSGQGFWAPIKGVIGISVDKETVTGISFYEQSETPGLGARITEPDFRNKFAGVKLGDGSKLIGIAQTGSKLDRNEVHAISGATQTCVRLEKLINGSLAQWRQKINQETP